MCTFAELVDMDRTPRISILNAELLKQKKQQISRGDSKSYLKQPSTGSDVTLG